MKIRHKQSGVEIEGEFERCGSVGGTAGGSASSDLYFISRAGSCYGQSEWEAVKPVPVWRDVTSECYVYVGSSCIIRGVDGMEIDIQNGYRICKVKVEWFSGVPLGLAKQGVAFIVEKMEP